jgi:hypothetical protein
LCRDFAMGARKVQARQFNIGTDMAHQRRGGFGQ